MAEKFKHGNYTITADDAAQYREGSERLYVPPAVIVVHEEPRDESEVRVMIGKSPCDGKMVIHIDGHVGDERGELARVYLNDGLIVGEEKE